MVFLVQEYFMNSARNFPKKIAVNYNKENITYEQLDLDSNKLANFLIQIVQQNSRIAFCLPKSINSVKCVLSILKADCCYVPLDPNSPPERLQQIIEDCTPTVIICDNNTHHRITEAISNITTKNDSFRGILIILSSKDILSRTSHPTQLFWEEEINQESDTLPRFNNKGIDLAYIIYTSGSTGKPKGVMITHDNVISFIEWIVPTFRITNNDVISNHAPMHFDLSTFDMYSTFKSGAKLILVPPDLNLFPEKLVQFIEQKEITIWMSVPSILSYIAKVDILNSKRIPALRLIIPTGEVFPTTDLVYWMELFPQKKFVNMFGPTETTVECTYYCINKIPTDLSINIPIGKACDHLEIFALKEDGTVAGVEEIGELYVRGPSVSPGYWNNPQKTKECFVENNLFPNINNKCYRTGDLVKLQEDGNYLFKGRKDSQIKFRGYRIELGEIEAALSSLKSIREVAAIYSTKLNEIICFISQNSPKTIEKIKEDLKKKIPEYMIPKKFIIKDSLPRTNTGKIDKTTLKNEYLY